MATRKISVPNNIIMRTTTILRPAKKNNTCIKEFKNNNKDQANARDKEYNNKSKSKISNCIRNYNNKKINKSNTYIKKHSNESNRSSRS